LLYFSSEVLQVNGNVFNKKGMYNFAIDSYKKAIEMLLNKMPPDVLWTLSKTVIKTLIETGK